MFGTRSILLSLFLTAICVPLSAEPASRETGPRLASVQEGEAIVQAAWELRHGLIPKPDCSHFVHAAYTHAGFLYEYAASRAIFVGIDGFHRVTRPQAGDVIVWQGHIGIVIDPRQHSFYSSVTSGFAIESYQSHYWIGRGNPRFYRFVVNELPSAPALFNVALLSSASAQVLSSLTKFFPAKPPKLVQPDTPEIVAESDGSESAAIEFAQVQLVPTEQPDEVMTEQTREVLEDQPVQTQASEVATNDRQTSDQIHVTSRVRPSKKEVLAAVRRSVDANGKQLVQSGALDSQPSVAVVDRFRIVAINLQGNSGLADVEVKQRANFQYGKAIPARMKARRRVILSRQEQGWVLVMPQDLVCVNRNLAVAALTEDLATMTLTPTNSPDSKVSLGLLNQLVSEKRPGPRWWARVGHFFTAIARSENTQERAGADFPAMKSLTTEAKSSP